MNQQMATLVSWKKLIIKYSDVNESNVYQNHHVIKRVGILSLKKLSFKDIYLILILNTANKPTSSIYLLENTTLDLSKIYL